MGFDFGIADNTTAADPKTQSLIEIAAAPQGEFDFDFGGPGANAQASQPSTANKEGEIDLINQPVEKSMDELLNSKTDNQIKEEQDKTDKI